MKLGELFTKHGSDKDTAHSYGAMYDSFVGPMKDRIHSVLEVGVLGGASLRAWCEYFGPAVCVYGIDKWPQAGPAPDATILLCDSMNPTSVLASLGAMTFDLIVDDGGHDPTEQSATYNNLWDRVNPGGLYVVEDIQHESTAEHFRALGAEVVDLRRVKGKFDDLVAVFRKPPADPPPPAEPAPDGPGQPELAAGPE